MASLLQREYEGLFLGEKLGSGMSRKVYACRHDPEYVVKVERDSTRFQNVMEWETWNQLQHQAAGKWLAPCLAISPSGLILLQRRVEPLRKADAPPKMPAFFSDFKYRNYGVLDGKVVCCDYGTCIALSQAAIMRMKKAEWHNGL